MELSDESNISIPLHLKGLYKEARSHCKEEEKRKVTNLLVKYQDVFSKQEYDLGLRSLGEYYHIDTGDAEPIEQIPRRVPLALVDKEEKVRLLSGQNHVKQHLRTSRGH